MPDSAPDSTAGSAGAERFRPLLFSIAYGMTGSVGDAEDIVQDAYLGLTRAQQSGTRVTDPKAYLTTAVTRLGINHLRSARVRRETYVGDWLPEPVVVPPGPAEHAELSDALSMAFLVLLEALSPVERAVFMLREVFGYAYPDVARLIGKSEVNCRQIFARARQRISAAPATPAMSRAVGEELARRFFAAAAGGDLDALLGLLAPDVVLFGDGGGKTQVVGHPSRAATASRASWPACSAAAAPSAWCCAPHGSTPAPAACCTTPRTGSSPCSSLPSRMARSRPSAAWSTPTSSATSAPSPTWRGSPA
ncbi:sigma-70 family RNA polymerase sigma factor [Dactylosporangium darangshiense]|uniref:sigma-70 family RNA polymerase sigma factor n=1 Tax=Dactylosporangium darangshiense TaxID=579108 RepID=UPI003639EC27